MNASVQGKKKNTVLHRIKKYRILYLLAIIPFAYLIVFRYYSDKAQKAVDISRILEKHLDNGIHDDPGEEMWDIQNALADSPELFARHVKEHDRQDDGRHEAAQQSQQRDSDGIEQYLLELLGPEQLSLGWSTIIYLAALTNINTELFEAARLDGAGPVQRIRYII